MRYIILSISIFFITVNIFAQDNEPLPFKFNYYYSDSTTTIDYDHEALDPNDFKQEGFKTLWMWSQHYKLARATKSSGFWAGHFKIDSNQGNNLPVENYVRPTMVRYDTNDSIYDKQGYFAGYVHSKSMQFEPLLKIDTVNPSLFDTTLNRQRNAVWGFKFINNNITINSSDTLLNLRKSDFNDSAIVLSDPWMNNRLFRYIKDSLSITRPEPVDKTRDTSDIIWYLTINLRKLSYNDGLSDYDTVLIVKLPYTLQDGSKGNIRFNKFPYGFFYDSYRDTLINFQGQDRGIAMKLSPYLRNSSEFAITNGMLPPDDTSDYQNITLSAQFICDGDTVTPKHNPYIKHRDTLDASIDSLGIEVKYMDNCDLGLNYIRIENYYYRKLARGDMDSNGTITMGDQLFPKDGSIHDVLQSSLTGIQNIPDSTHPYQKFMGFMGRDEGPKQEWGMLRYMNRITNGLFYSARDIDMSKHYEYYVNQKANIKMMHFDNGAPMPTAYYPIGGFGSRRGYRVYENDTTGLFNDTLNSYHDTFIDMGLVKNRNYGLIEKDSTIAIKNLNLQNYFEVINSFWDGSVQSRWESKLIQKYFDGPLEDSSKTAIVDNDNNFLYSDKYWWLNVWPSSDWKNINSWSCVDTVLPESCTHLYDTVYNYYGTKIPKTGEQHRLRLWTALILGCKGFMYDRAGSVRLPDPTDFFDSFYFDNDDDEWKQKYPYSILGVISEDEDKSDSSGLAFLHDDEHIEGDYIDMEDDNTGFHMYIDTNTVKDSLEISANRVYLGRKSARLEIYKTHSWIRAVEDTLMDLRLVGWFDKGYKSWYHQDPEINQDTVLKEFVSLDSSRWKVRQLGRLDQYGQTPAYEHWDSTFFDITLLRKDDDPNLDSNVFYIGIQNRRTDPLIYHVFGGDEAPITQMMLFLSTAEFEALCDIGGYVIPWDTSNPDNFRDSSYWQNRWWKRLGCREINIPFNYTYDENNPEKYALLRVTELGKDTDLDTAGSWWSDSRYYNRIDTIIGQDKEVVMNMLPGEGKILRVEVLEPPDKFDGLLTYSNQRKLISYPIRDASGNFVATNNFFHATNIRHLGGKFFYQLC